MHDYRDARENVAPENIEVGFPCLVSRTFLFGGCLHNRTTSSNLAPVNGGNTLHTPEMHLSPPLVPPTSTRTDDAVVMFHCSEPLK